MGHEALGGSTGIADRGVLLDGLQQQRCGTSPASAAPPACPGRRPHPRRQAGWAAQLPRNPGRSTAAGSSPRTSPPTWPPGPASSASATTPDLPASSQAAMWEDAAGATRVPDLLRALLANRRYGGVLESGSSASSICWAIRSSRPSMQCVWTCCSTRTQLPARAAISAGAPVAFSHNDKAACRRS